MAELPINCRPCGKRKASVLEASSSSTSPKKIKGSNIVSYKYCWPHSDEPQLTSVIRPQSKLSLKRKVPVFDKTSNCMPGTSRQSAVVSTTADKWKSVDVVSAPVNKLHPLSLQSGDFNLSHKRTLHFKDEPTSIKSAVVPKVSNNVPCQSSSPDSVSSLSPDFKRTSKPAFSSTKEEKPEKKVKKSDAAGEACAFCYKKLSSSKCLMRHQKCCSKNPSGPGFLCKSCGRQFHRRYMFLKHTHKCKPEAKATSRFACSYPVCNAIFIHRVDLYDHLLNEHKGNLTPPQTFNFDNEAKFKLWKAQIEDSSYSFFSQQYGRHNNKVFFYCQHDGMIKTHRKKGEPARKTDRKNLKGVIKSNEMCLSMMSVTYFDDGKVKVDYRPSHSHPCHPRDLPHHPLSEDTNDFINRQLAWSVPPRKIWLSLRDDSYKRQNRFQKPNFVRNNVVNLKTLTERRRKLHAGGRHAEDDARSVYFKVQSLMQASYNPVLIYKPYQDALVTGPEGAENLPLDVFLLAFQSKEQLNMLQEGSHSILVMDETHSTNSYGFKLLNLMVKDKFNQGYPVGHAITSKSNEVTLQYVFRAIKDRCPELNINCCITDDDPTLINSLEMGIGEPVWHILCIWHIHRTIQSNLRNYVKDSELVKEMYEVICAMIEAVSEEEFQGLVKSFINEYANKAPSFCKYFRETFLPKQKKWAKCYRLDEHGGTETTMLVESFHNILKSVYLKRIPNRRLDDLLDLMFQIEEDYYTRYTNALNMECLPSIDLKEIRQRHLRGVKIARSHVSEVSINHFEVRSAQDENENGTHKCYNVLKTADTCSSMPCLFVCPEPECKGLCSHLYQCSCPDFSPLCKHIHKVHLLQLDSHLQPVVKQPACDTLLENPLFYSIENYTSKTADQIW